VFCILSGKYLNFYRDETQKKPFDWFYLKNCIASDSQGVISVANQSGLLKKLKFTSHEATQKWLTQIRQCLFEDLIEQQPD